MMKKLLQNTNEKTQLDKVKYSKLFRKHDASIPLHSNSRKYQKITTKYQDKFYKYQKAK